MSETRVIDADGHVMELDEQLWEYMGPPYKHGQWHRSYAFFPSLDGFTRAITNGGGAARTRRGRMAAVSKTSAPSSKPSSIRRWGWPTASSRTWTGR